MTHSTSADVGTIHNLVPAMPLNVKSNADLEAAELYDRMHNHFIVQSICDGWLDENLNDFKEKEEIREHLKNRLDWLGVNYYTRSVFQGKKSL